MKYRYLKIIFTIIVITLFDPLKGTLNQSETDIKVQKIMGTVYLIQKSRQISYKGKSISWTGYACMSAGSEGILLVDNCMPETTESFLSALRKTSDQPIRFIINTHWHSDHTGSNHLLRDSALIIAHEWTRKEMMREKRYSEEYTIPPAPRKAWPTLTFSDSLNMYFNNETVQLIHFPHGHTQGDILVYFPDSGVIFMGDTFNGTYLPRVYGSVKKYSEQYHTLLQQLPENTIIISGHRSPVTYNDLKLYYNMLSKSINWVRSKIKAGILLDEILQKDLPPFLQTWEDPYMFNSISGKEWITNIYYEITKELK